MHDQLICIICNLPTERVAQEGQELQPTPGFICESCQNGAPQAPAAEAPQTENAPSQEPQPVEVNSEATTTEALAETPTPQEAADQTPSASSDETQVTQEQLVSSSLDALGN